MATFVREVIQNANDQRLEDPEVHFRFRELTGRDLEAFLTAMDWLGLSAHLAAASKEMAGQSQVERLEELNDDSRLVVLTVEDRNTVGLTGDEFSGHSHFRALCKDTLFSHKQNEAAGGSYGLGKSVLWAFSSFKTVLFLSNLSEHPPGRSSPRLIGRTELSSHSIGDESFSGPGWFGSVSHVGEAERAESIWGKEAQKLADRLSLTRSSTTGTSILIVGFRDPAGDEEADPEAMAAQLRLAATEWFWPTLAMPARPLSIWVAAKSGSPVGESDLGPVGPFFRAYAGRDSTLEALEAPGEIVVRDLPFEIPARQNGRSKTKGTVRLIVRLALDHESAERTGAIAMFRGPGMVVRYRDLRSVGLGSRPFHAVLACGLARSPEAPTEEDHVVEAFLRAAEPPGHDQWISTPRLKNEFKRGYQTALKKLEADVRAAVRELVIPRPRQGERGPDLLAKRFPLGKVGGEGGGKTIFRFSGLSARFLGGRWYFNGEVEPAVPTSDWSCAIRLAAVGEDGRDLFDVELEEIQTQSGAGECSVVEGVGFISAHGKKASLRFEGVSAQIPETAAGELALEVKAVREG